jgi:predicted DNA-binding ribbon-helix-helix protein
VRSSRLVNRNVVASRGRTSMRLEPELWDALAEICTRERQDLPSLMRQIEAMSYAGSRTSAVRVFVVQYFRAATPRSRSGSDQHRAPAGPPV